MKKLQKFSLFILILVILAPAFGVSTAAYDNIPYQSYSYNYEGEPIRSPHAYIPGQIIKTSDFGLAELSAPEDMCTDTKGNIYIADTAGARVVVIDTAAGAAKEVRGFTFEGTEYALTKPTGVFVTEKGELFVADSTGLNIYVFSKELECIRIIKKPESSLLPADFSYIPTKISVDKAGRIYIVSGGNTYGIVALNNEGEFSSFVGAQKVSVSVVDKLWRKFMTKEQKKRTLNYVPTNYNNIAIDEKGFLYVTSTYSDLNAVIQAIRSRSTDNRYAMIKKLNSSGEDVLLRGGFFPPGGDVKITMAAGGNATNTDIFYGPSGIYDVAVGKNGVYSLMDQKRGKIFTYDSSGNLLYAFAGAGQQTGLFRKLGAIDYLPDSRLVTLDTAAGTITVFETTEYGRLVAEAIELSAGRKYQESAAVYEKILLENGNFDLANIGIGTAMMRQGKFKEAMRYFKLANDVENYSEAYSNYRKELLGNYILLIPLLIAVIGFLISRFFRFVKRFNDGVPTTKQKRSLKEELLYGFYIIFHPFDGFWELKRGGRGGVRGASIILTATIASMLFREVGQGYIYTGKLTSGFNAFASIAMLLGLVAVWCISNWCLTSLMYGEGGLKDIYVASCYALLPVPFFVIPATLLSHFVTANELMFVNFLFVIGFIWAAFLLFGAILSTHDYQLGTNVLTVILTIVGMIIIVFLMLLFVNLLGQMFAMISNIYNEVTFRL